MNYKIVESNGMDRTESYSDWTKILHDNHITVSVGDQFFNPVFKATVKNITVNLETGFVTIDVTEQRR